MTARWIVVPAAVAVAALVAAGVYAYFAAGGAGSGTASVGAGSALAVRGTTSGTLYPGSAVAVGLTVDNRTLAHEHVGTVYLVGVRACTGIASSWDPSLGSCSNNGTEQSGCESFDPGDAADSGRSQVCR